MQILFEDNHLIAVNKPAGVLAQGDKTGDDPIAEYVKAYIKDRYAKPGDVFLGVVHRLDRPVSGVTIFARTSKALERMNKLFADRQVEKVYWAIVNNRPDPLSGHLTHYLLKDETTNKTKAFDQLSNRSEGAKKADLDYELLGELGNHFLLEVRPTTGRPHQIRAQLAKAGYPIRGDVKYKGKNIHREDMISLHCRSLSFIHPVKKEKVRITAEPPNEQGWKMFQ